jgi:hypothetical protein
LEGNTLNIIEELPKEFKPLIILGEIDGYLHIYSFLDDSTILALLDMAIQSVDSSEYDVKTTLLQ